jgi:YaiO family outer membrane protein
MKTYIRPAVLVALLFLGYVVMVFPLFVFGGEVVQKQKAENADDLFKKAQALAQDGKFKEAREICRAILKEYPTYHDVRVFQGRLYLWSKDYDIARDEFNRVILEQPDCYDAWSALIDTEFWTHNLDAALKHCGAGLEIFPDDENILLKKIRILIELEDYKSASFSVRRLLTVNPSHREAKELFGRIQHSTQLFEFAQFYRLERIHRKDQSIKSWEFMTLELAVKPKFGTLISRFNHACRQYGKETFSGTQFEIDAWPVFNETIYANFNAGYSANAIFPRYRLGGELYFNLPNAFELSGGFRYLDFSNERVYILTGTLGKYYKDYWFSLRPLIASDSKGLSTSGLLRIRRYKEDRDNYLGFTAAFGIIPVNLYFREDIQRYASFRLGIEAKSSLFKSFLVKLQFRYEHEEYQPGRYGSRYVMEIRFEERIFRKY